MASDLERQAPLYPETRFDDLLRVFTSEEYF